MEPVTSYDTSALLVANAFENDGVSMGYHGPRQIHLSQFACSLDPRSHIHCGTNTRMNRALIGT